MGNIVINAFGGEGTLFSRAFLAALPAWPWANPEQMTILLRWLDLANGANGADGETDAAKTARMREIFNSNAEVISRVFGVPKVATDAPRLAKGENSIAAAYADHTDSSLLALQFTQADQAEKHLKGFQGDPCAGTACIRGQAQPLPAGYFDPKVNGQQLTPDLWITVGGFRGGGCATTLVPLEAEERMEQKNLDNVPSVLIAALPYSAHEEDKDDPHVQLKSDNAFCGTKAILSGGFDITHWAKRYFISTYLENGTPYRPITAGFEVDNQNTRLIATNLVTADCAYRAIADLDPVDSFGSGKVYVPAVDQQIKNGFGYHLQININRMRALCWFAAAVKELLGGWELHNTKAGHAPSSKQTVENLKTYCDQMMIAFLEMQRGKYEKNADQKKMPFVFMPDSFFTNYFTQHDSKWWEKMVTGDDSKADDFHTGLLDKKYKFRANFSNRVLAKALEDNKQDIVAALGQIFKDLLEGTQSWDYAKKNGSNEGGGKRLLFPLDTAEVNNFVFFGSRKSPTDENSVMGAVNAEDAKIAWNGFIGGSCGRLFDYEARIEEANENDPMVVKYTSLLFSHFLRDMREIPMTRETYHPTEGTIFSDIQKHLNTEDGVQTCEIGGVKVGCYMNPLKGTDENGNDNAVIGSAYFLLPTPGDWGASVERDEQDAIVSYDYSTSAWTELIGYKAKKNLPPDTIEDVFADLTAFELQIVYTMLVAINHYAPTKTGNIDPNDGNEGMTHERYRWAKKLLTLLEARAKSKLTAAIGAPTPYPHAKWELMDYDNPVCNFIPGQTYNPNKFFARQLAYYRMEKGTEYGGIYCAYPFSETGSRWLETFTSCDMTVKADIDAKECEAKKITVTVNFKRANSEIPETRSYVYEQKELIRIMNAPAISMIPQFLGYDANSQPNVVYRYLWAAGEKRNAPCTLWTAEKNLILTVAGLPAAEAWRLCQKKQRVSDEVVDTAWSSVSSEEKQWWTLCDSKDLKRHFGCLGRKPIAIPKGSGTVNVNLTKPTPEPYRLELYFDFGTANSHMDVYVKTADDTAFKVAQANETAFEPNMSEYYLTLDLSVPCIAEKILQLHDENLTPTTMRQGTIPTMIQSYGQVGLADQVYTFTPGAAQYEVGRIVYPLKETMNRIYSFAMGNDQGTGAAQPRSLADLGFCDQMKINSGNAIRDDELPKMREFFMRGFIQNVVARYYSQYHCWPKDIALYCSYPTIALRNQYFSQLVQMLPNINNLTSFYSEAISFVCYDGGGKVKKDSVTIDIGAGTTDIAMCRFDNANQVWMLEKTASLQFAGMRIVEQSIIESLRRDKVDIASVFNGLDGDRLKLLGILLEDPTQTEALRMLIRNLIADGYLQSNTSVFDMRLRVRMLMRTVGLLMAINELVGKNFGDYELYLHGGPIKSLKNITLEKTTFEQIVSLIFGKTPHWDSNKAAITVGMSNIVHSPTPLVNEGNYQPNMLESGIQTVFNSPTAADAHNFQYDDCEIRPLAEEAVKAFAGIAPDSDKTLDDVSPFLLLQKNKDIRALVDAIEAAKTEFTAKIHQEIAKCQYYDGMDPRLLTMYAIDFALTKAKFEAANWK